MIPVRTPHVLQRLEINQPIQEQQRRMLLQMKKETMQRSLLFLSQYVSRKVPEPQQLTAIPVIQGALAAMQRRKMQGDRCQGAPRTVPSQPRRRPRSPADLRVTGVSCRTNR